MIRLWSVISDSKRLYQLVEVSQSCCHDHTVIYYSDIHLITVIGACINLIALVNSYHCHQQTVRTNNDVELKLFDINEPPRVPPDPASAGPMLWCFRRPCLIGLPIWSTLTQLPTLCWQRNLFLCVRNPVTSEYRVAIMNHNCEVYWLILRICVNTSTLNLDSDSIMLIGWYWAYY